MAAAKMRARREERRSHNVVSMATFLEFPYCHKNDGCEAERELMAVSGEGSADRWEIFICSRARRGRSSPRTAKMAFG